MDIQSLEYFVVLAEYQNMVRAAEELHVTQPAISKSLKKIEDECGLQLFDRIHKNVKLNGNGKLFYSYASEILRIHRKMMSEIKDISLAADEGTVKIFTQIFTVHISEIVKEINASFPNINLEMMNTHQDDWDIWLMANGEQCDYPDAIELIEERMYIFVPRNSRFAQLPYINLEDLRDEQFIAYCDEKINAATVNYWCKQAGFEPNIALKADTNYVFIQIVELGLGCAFIPEFASDSIDTKLVVKKEIRSPECMRYSWLVLNQNKYPPKAVRNVKKFLVDWFQKKRIKDI